MVASGQEERLIFPHSIPDYSHFLQNKLIKAHQNKLINHGMRMIGTLKESMVFMNSDVFTSIHVDYKNGNC